MSLPDVRDFFGGLKRDYLDTQRKAREARRRSASRSNEVVPTVKGATDTGVRAPEQISASYSRLPKQADTPYFRLLFLEPGAEGAAIVCQVVQYKFWAIDRPSYEALSYCWKPETPVDIIRFNGSTFHIGRNLADALRSLRSRSTTRTLWVDALCINQADLAERAQQVRIMHQIYEQAARVLIWLGPPDTSGTEAIRVLRELAAEADARSRAPSITARGQSAFKGRAAAYENVRSLLLRDWFSRVWTVQEVAVARKAVIVWKDQLIDWENISSGISEGFRIDLFLDGFLGRSTEVVFHRHRALETAREGWDEDLSTTDRLQHLLASFRNRRAKDPRDKVFALRGLIGAKSDLSELPLDYSISPVDVYIHTAMYILQHSRDLHLLSMSLSNTAVNPRLGGSLPSWVPDWSNSNFIAWPFEDSTFGSKPISSAVSSSTAAPCCSFGSNRSLLLEGYQKDVIIAAAEPLDIPLVVTLGHDEAEDNTEPQEPLDDSGTQNLTWYQRTKRLGLHQMGTTLDRVKASTAYLRTLIGWERFADFYEDGYRIPNTSSTAKIAYMETLLAGRSHEGDETVFDEWLISLNAIRPTAKMPAKLLNDQLFAAVAAPGYMKATWRSFPEFNSRLGYAHGRRLARTQQGHLALVPRHARVGDMIGLFRGSRWPLSYRIRDDGDYMLIGQAYLHGLVYEEEFEDYRCETITIR